MLGRGHRRALRLRGKITRRAFLGAAASFSAARGVLGAEDLERAIKAAYLVKFGGFVEWPDSAFASPASPLVICVAGGQPFGALLDRAARGQSAGRHPIEIRVLQAVTRGSGCHMLFAADASAAYALAAVQGEPVLTVTDLPRTAPRKGIINFVVDDNRVRFEIDARAAAEAGLRISSQLMALAVNTPR
jgi:hypothetical protein